MLALIGHAWLNGVHVTPRVTVVPKTHKSRLINVAPPRVTEGLPQRRLVRLLAIAAVRKCRGIQHRQRPGEVQFPGCIAVTAQVTFLVAECLGVIVGVIKVQQLVRR
ncbi:MAG: hypothetical protein OSB29_11885, partial [Verrucomicrobiota bacterium]|nr:hypothetical protein [Verrucomicrobiota bacterium]